MIKVKIHDGNAVTRTGNTNGRDWKMRTQDAYLELNGEIRRVSISLSDDQAPFPIGNYYWDPEKSLYFDNRGNLAVSRRFDLVLAQPTAAPSTKAA